VLADNRFSAFAARLGHGYTLYGLRHFMATQLGVVASVNTLRQRMGHGSLAVTSGYTHRVEAGDRPAARFMADLLDGPAASGDGAPDRRSGNDQSQQTEREQELAAPQAQRQPGANGVGGTEATGNKAHP
jgi:hypothetical protein